MASSRNLKLNHEVSTGSTFKHFSSRLSMLKDERVTNTENQEINQRVKTLEELLSKQNIHIKNFETKIERLEEQITVHKVQIKSLENTVIELQQLNLEKNKKDPVLPNRPNEKMSNQMFKIIQVDDDDQANTNLTNQQTQRQEQESNETNSEISRVNNGMKYQDTTNSIVKTGSKHVIGLNKDAFIQWMDSRESEFSLWANSRYRRFLLSYIAKIYDQKPNTYRILSRLKIESNGSNELDQLHVIIKEFEKQPGAKESLKKWQIQTRTDRRFIEIKSFFEYTSAYPAVIGHLKIIEPAYVDEIISRENIKDYLDIDCRIGVTAAEIGAYLQLKKENIFGGNEHDQHSDKITYISVNLTESTIDLVDNRVDLITCLVILHHTPQIDSMLAEIVRVLRPDGYLIIREHNCKQEYSLTAKYLNFVHAFMMIAGVGEYSRAASDHSNNATRTNSEKDFDENLVSWQDQKSRVIEYTSSIHYRTRVELQQKFNEIGFDLRAIISYEADGSELNPQELYYGIYQLKKKLLDSIA
ncbi:hypothetical protein I4U23_017584 [Adineta vaga]|nr:hypothetical protein I4U23_017584 [Adineta vaga]